MADTPQSLLARLRRPEDQGAWQRMVAVYDPLLRSWLSSQGLPKSDIDDLVQDVLVVVCRRISEFEHNGRPGAFRKWLKNIVFNRAREFWREGRLRKATVADMSLLEGLEDQHSGLSTWWDREHDREVARRLLAYIRPEFSQQVWDIFRLLVTEGVPPAQVAEQLGVSVNSVYAAKCRVLARLREEAADLIDL